MYIIDVTVFEGETESHIDAEHRGAFEGTARQAAARAGGTREAANGQRQEDHVGKSRFKDQRP